MVRTKDKLMKNKTVGTVLVVTSGVCCTLGMVGVQIAAALDRGLFRLAKIGGRVPGGPDSATLGWTITAAVVVLAVLGVIFLFTRDSETG